MKRSLLLLVSSLLLSATVQADTLASLQEILKNHNMQLVTDPEQLIKGTEFIAISQGPWQDRQVASFEQRYQRKPMALPLTRATQKDDKENLAPFARGDGRDIFYLYVHLPDQPEPRDALLKKLNSLMTDDFQQQLEDKSFSRTPGYYQQLWKVRIGAIPPTFPGGDY